MTAKPLSSILLHAPLLKDALAVRIQGRALGVLNPEAYILGGSYFRGCLLMELAEVYDLPQESAASAAIAVELLHSASLVHDDVIDRDLERRGRPSAYAELGGPEAILLGDRLIAEVYECLVGMDLPSKVVVQLVGAVSRTISKASLGQSLQLACDDGMSGTLDACMEWSRLKTGMLVALPVELALIMAEADDSAKVAVPVAVELGLAYQMIDDLNDWIGCKRGRNSRSDERNGEWTFARIAERDFPGQEVEQILSWIQACWDRMDAMLVLLPAPLRGVLVEMRQSMSSQLAELPKQHLLKLKR